MFVSEKKKLYQKYVDFVSETLTKKFYLSEYVALTHNRTSDPIQTFLYVAILSSSL